MNRRSGERLFSFLSLYNQFVRRELNCRPMFGENYVIARVLQLLQRVPKKQAPTGVEHRNEKERFSPNSRLVLLVLMAHSEGFEVFHHLRRKVFFLGHHDDRTDGHAIFFGRQCEEALLGRPAKPSSTCQSLDSKNNYGRMLPYIVDFVEIVFTMHRPDSVIVSKQSKACFTTVVTN